MNLTRKVENLLKNRPELRDSDRKLLMAIWEIEGLQLSDSQQRKFMYCSTAESITRARRLLKAKYPASEKIEEERFKRFKAHQEAFGQYPLMRSQDD